MKQRLFFNICVALLSVLVGRAQSFSNPSVVSRSASELAGTWAAAAEWTGSADMPRYTAFAGYSLRQVLKVSVGSQQLSLCLSNEFSKEPLEIEAVYVADALDSCDIHRFTARYLTFKGHRKICIEAGTKVSSDWLKYELRPLQKLAVTICYGRQIPKNMTSHRGSRTTSYIAAGLVGAKECFKTVEKVDHWYNICQLNVVSQVPVVAVLGNSLTDGRGSTTNAQNRWPDEMSRVLQTIQPRAVLNLGIGGNCVVSGGISQPALKRFERDILGQVRVNQLILFQGTNDIGTSRISAEETASRLIEAYRILIGEAHKKGIKVYGGTITPFKGNAWYTAEHETARQMVNTWIRHSGTFDGVLDFDVLVRQPQDAQRLKPEYSDDWLHLNPTGYRVMGQYAAHQLLHGAKTIPDKY